MKKQFKLLVIIFLLFFNDFEGAQQKQNRVEFKLNKTNSQEYQIALSFHLNPGETINPNSVNISTDNPYIELSNWRTSNDILNSSKDLANDFQLLVNASVLGYKKINQFDLFLSYLLSGKSETEEENFRVDLDPDPNNNEQSQKSTNVENNQVEDSYLRATNKNEISKKSFWNSFSQFSANVQDLIKKSNSIWLQLILVFILGILMSFTPCIYPVIPITAGILQAQGSKSIYYNFFISICYALGIATTFATFGLTAALSGHLFGQILNQPIFVIFISAFLIYLAFSMFGFYDMYVPKFLRGSSKIKHKGSPLSAFIFGVVSGSIASPCLSPGLALLLTIVASLANKFLGFLLLFSFGIGLSVPLIIIGTFSSSLNILPKAGMWMDEVKKLFGFLLIGMSFYYLKNILPYSILLFLIALSLWCFGIYYLKSINSYDSKSLKYFKNVFGVFLIASSIFIFAKAIQIYFEKDKKEESLWLANYDEAVKQAQVSKKNLIIDVGAPFCTLCKAIDKYVFNDPSIKPELNNFVLVKVDASNSNEEPFAMLKQKYSIIGVPTILIINPNTGQLLKRFEGELYDMAKEDVISDLKRFSLNN